MAGRRLLFLGVDLRRLNEGVVESEGEKGVVESEGEKGVVGNGEGSALKELCVVSEEAREDVRNREAILWVMRMVLFFEWRWQVEKVW